MFAKMRNHIGFFVVFLPAIVLPFPAAVTAWEFAPAEMTMAVGSMGSMIGGLSQNPAFMNFNQGRNRNREIDVLKVFQAELLDFKSCINGLRDSIAKNSVNEIILDRRGSCIHEGVGKIEELFKNITCVSICT